MLTVIMLSIVMLKVVMLSNVLLSICRETGECLRFVYFLVGWHPSAVSLPPGDIILAQLACPLNDIIFCLHWDEVTYLSTNIGVAVCRYADVLSVIVLSVVMLIVVVLSAVMLSAIMLSVIMLMSLC